MGLYRTAEISVIPLLVAASILLQQELNGVGFLFEIGHIVSVLAALSAIVFVFRYGNQKPGFVIILCLLMLRVGKQALPDIELMASLYEIVLFVFMSFAGHILWKRDPLRIQRQLSMVCLVGLPLMLLQVLGAGEWTQLLRTDFHDVYGDVTQYPTFLITVDELLTGNTLQPRPAGLFASNNGLSLVLAIAVGLTIWQPSRCASPFRDFMLAMVCVLAMSKTVYAVVAGVAFFAIIVGDVSQRRSALHFILSMLCGLFIYFLIFPGLWAVNVDYDSWRLNYAIRLSSLAQGFDIPVVDSPLHEWVTSMRPLLFDASGDLIQQEGGIATLASKMRWVLPVACLGALLVVLARYRKIGLCTIGRTFPGHVVIVGVSMVGLNFLTSSIFALYIGAVMAAIDKCLVGD